MGLPVFPSPGNCPLGPRKPRVRCGRGPGHLLLLPEPTAPLPRRRLPAFRMSPGILEKRFFQLKLKEPTGLGQGVI